MLAIDFERFVSEHPEQVVSASNAFEYWRGYLLGSGTSIEPYRHHMFFFSLVEPSQSAIQNLPSKFHSYILRSFDGCIGSFDSKGFVYVLLPGIAFWSPLNIRDDVGWGKNSHIKQRGKFKVAQKVKDERFGALVQESAEMASTGTLSERQQKKVAEYYQRVLAIKSATELANITEAIRHDSLLRRIREQRE